MDPAGDGSLRIDPPDGEFERTRVEMSGTCTPGAGFPTVADLRASSSPQDNSAEGWGLGFHWKRALFACLFVWQL